MRYFEERGLADVLGGPPHDAHPIPVLEISCGALSYRSHFKPVWAPTTTKDGQAHTSTVSTTCGMCWGQPRSPLAAWARPRKHSVS